MNGPTGAASAPPALPGPAAHRLDRRTLGAALVVGVVALAVRLLYLVELRASPFFWVPVIDAQTYDTLARELATGDWLGRPRPYWQPPLYPYFLAQLYALGLGPTLVRVVQMLIGASTAAVITLLGDAVGGRRVAWIAGLVTALYGPLIFFDGRLLPPTLILLLNSLGLYLFVRARSDPRRPGLLAAAGLAFGLATVARPDAFAVALALAVGLAWAAPPAAARSRATRSPAATRRPTAGWRLRRALLFLAAVCLPVAPITIRNLVVGNDLIWVSANGGVNFYLGNNARADETIALRPGLEWEHLVESPHRDAGLTRSSDRSRYFYARSFEFFRRQPAAAVANLGRKAIRFASSEEIRRNEDLYELRRESGLLRALVWRAGGFGFPLGLVAPLAALGMLVAWPRRRDLWPLHIYSLAYAAAVIAYFVTARYRLPVLPATFCFAALAVEHTLAWSHDRRRLMRLAIAVLAVAVLVNLNAASPQVDTRSEYWQLLAIAEHERGNHDEAVAAQRRALAGTPSSPELHYDLGVYLVAAGDTLAAMAAYRRAIELEPAYAEALLNLGMLLARTDSPEQSVELLIDAALAEPDLTPVQVAIAGAFLHSGFPDSALTHYDRAILIEPGRAEAWGGRGAALAAMGRQREAIAAYRRALELGGEQPAVLRGLGTALKNAGRNEEALPALRQAVALDPGDARLRVTLGQIYRRLGRLDDAEREYRAAIELDPNLAPAHTNLGDVYARKGLNDLARAALTTALTLDPQNTTALYNLAVVEVTLGNDATAIVYLERVLGIDPDHERARHALQLIRGEGAH